MFSSLKQIRFDAGFQVQERQVEMYDVSRSGPVLGDGSATEFYTLNTPIVDRTDDIDGDVTTADVTVYVDGVAVTVDAVDNETGKITLNAAPANNADIRVNYDWSSIPDSDVTTYRKWAYGKIISALSKVYVLFVDDTDVNPNWDGSPAEDYLQTLEATLAAGRLLQVVYTEENDGFHKQGKDKEKMAEAMLSDIKNNNVILVDSLGEELQRKATHDPVGYPNTDDTSSDVKDDGYHWPTNKKY